MSQTKEEKIVQVERKYKVTCHKDIKEKDLDDILKNKYLPLEVKNIAKNKKPDKFDKSDLTQASSSELWKLAVKYAKRSLPSSLRRELLVDIITRKFDINKLSAQEILYLGKHSQSLPMQSFQMYAGWLPFVKKQMLKKNLQKGIKTAGKISKSK